MDIGIIGTGRIAQRFVDTALKGSEDQISCIYNPHRSSAQIFAKKNHIPAYTDNLEILADNVQAVYVASPHETHFQYVKYLLEKGKHILCEKPMSLKEEEIIELTVAAKEKKLVLMEAVKSAYCEGFQALIKVAQSGEIGDVVDVEAAFTRLTDPNTREYKTPVYNGSFLEFGSYGILPVVRLLGSDYTSLRFQTIKDKNGVDIYTKAYFEYPKGMATVKTGLGVKSEGQLLISGTQGYIICESPWWMTKKFEVRYEDSSVKKVYEYPYEGSGLQYEWAEFKRRVDQMENQSASDEGNCVTMKESRAIAAVMEQWMKYKMK